MELTFLGFVVLSKFCVLSLELFHPMHFVEVIILLIEMYAGFSVSDLTGHHFMFFSLFKNLYAKNSNFFCF